MRTESSSEPRYRLLVALLLQLAALYALAAPAFAAPTNIRASLVVEGPARPGGEATLAILMQPQPGWHGYWLNPGDAGLGMTLDWTLPPGAKAGQPRYPVPRTLLVAGLMNHVYTGDYAVLVPVSIPSDARPDTSLPVALDAHWLACTEEICVPESARLQAVIPVAMQGARDPRFDTWRARLPAPLDAPATFARTPAALRLAIPLPAAMALDDPHLFIAQDREVAYAAPQRFSRSGDTLVVEMKRPDLAPGDSATISGVLRLNNAGDGISFTAHSGRVPSAGTPLEPGGGTGLLRDLPLLLLGALAGGLLLNVMPCVFPILSLKALSLARAGESETHARIEGLAYAAGVVLACLGLGALMLVLRAGGEQIGWAFQLQEPEVVAVLLLLATGITANFLGLFEMGIPGFASEGSPQGAFATGLLAAFVATPCTGPFMAAAMGAALLLPVVPALALFAALGLGIALPFLLVSFVPALRRRLPRPGPWMNRFRRWMALPMGLTALALVWLASRTGGMVFAWGAALTAVLLLAALVLSGHRQRTGRPAFAPATLGITAAVALSVLVLPRFVAAPQAESGGITGARPFSEAALRAARTSGHPVFVWMTADWCLTCKVNEQVAIERQETANAFRKAGVVVLRGDWTRRDPAITRYLTEHNAAGVPYYEWYPAGQGAARQLPQVLTPQMLIDLANDAANAG